MDKYIKYIKKQTGFPERILVDVLGISLTPKSIQANDRVLYSGSYYYAKTVCIKEG